MVVEGHKERCLIQEGTQLIAATIKNGVRFENKTSKRHFL
jgi:hypothetical protein